MTRLRADACACFKASMQLLYCGVDGNPKSELEWPIPAARGWGGVGGAQTKSAKRAGSSLACAEVCAGASCSGANAPAAAERDRRGDCPALRRVLQHIVDVVNGGHKGATIGHRVGERRGFNDRCAQQQRERQRRRGGASCAVHDVCRGRLGRCVAGNGESSA